MGKSPTEVPFESVEMLMEKLRAYEHITEGAKKASRRMIGGGGGSHGNTGNWQPQQSFRGSGGGGSGGRYQNQGQSYRSASPAKRVGYSGGRVMTVEELAEDKLKEMEHVHAVVMNANQYRVGKNRDCPLFRWFDTMDQRRKALQDWGPQRCLNCGQEGHRFRKCEKGYLNEAGVFHEDMGKGTPQEIEQRWRRWKDRLNTYKY